MRLIDADLMVELIKAQITTNEDDKSTAGMAAKRVMGRFIEFVNDLPAAQPDLSSYSDKLWRAAYERGKAEAQRMRGRWMLDNDGFYVCDQCGEPCAGELMGKPRDRFCKWCGAKMNGGEHNDN